MYVQVAKMPSLSKFGLCFIFILNSKFKRMLCHKVFFFSKEIAKNFGKTFFGLKHLLDFDNVYGVGP
jgi:hypothetical protein